MKKTKNIKLTALFLSLAAITATSCSNEEKDEELLMVRGNCDDGYSAANTHTCHVFVPYYIWGFNGGFFGGYSSPVINNTTIHNSYATNSRGTSGGAYRGGFGSSARSSVAS